MGSQGAATGSVAAILVPEKGLLGREVHTGLATHFWDQPAHSSVSLDCLVNSLPCQPSPLPLTAPSGISRSQLLVAAQAVRLPAMPAFTMEHGGVVADRVVLHTGGDHWWANMTARVKAQKICQRKKWAALQDAGNYVVCANFKSSLGRDSIFKGKLEVEPASHAKALAQAAAAEKEEPEEAVAGGEATLQQLHVRSRPFAQVAASANYRYRLQGADLRARMGVNERQRADGAGALSTFVRTPLSCTLDLVAPSTGNLSWLQYRLGLHQASVPVVVGSAGGASSLRSVLHGQGGVAVQGQVPLWQATPTHRLGEGAPRTVRQAVSAAFASSATGASPSAAPALFPSRVAAPRRRSTARRGRDGERSGDGGDGGGRRAGAFSTLASRIHALSSRVNGGAPAAQEAAPATRRASRLDSLGRVGASDSEVLIVPEAVQDSLLDSSQALQNLRQDVQGLTEWVSAGGLVTQLQRITGTKGLGKASGSAPPRAPWSVFVPAPHVKVGGLLGITAGGTVLDRTHANPLVRGRAADWDAGVASAAATTGGGGEVSDAVGGGGSATAKSAFLTWLAGNAEQVRRQARVQPFATAAASVQLGRFRRPVLDFTRLVARLDLGLPGHSPARKPAAGDHPALALQSPGVWHALSLSACQQVIGPLRACVDLRFSLDSEAAAWGAPPAAPDPAGGGGGGAKGAAALRRLRGAASGKHVRALAGHVRGIRPSLVEAVYALDMVVPGSAGAARLVAWYAPARQEGMVELRLL